MGKPIPADVHNPIRIDLLTGIGALPTDSEYAILPRPAEYLSKKQAQTSAACAGSMLSICYGWGINQTNLGASVLCCRGFTLLGFLDTDCFCAQRQLLRDLMSHHHHCWDGPSPLRPHSRLSPYLPRCLCLELSPRSLNWESSTDLRESSSQEVSTCGHYHVLFWVWDLCGTITMASRVGAVFAACMMI